MKEELLKIINHYGARGQLRQFNEESYELIEAIRDYEEQKEACENIGCSRIHIDKCREHITEEIADCYVILKQFQYYYGINREEIRKIMNFKIDRQLERIERENNER